MATLENDPRSSSWAVKEVSLAVAAYFLLREAISLGIVGANTTYDLALSNRGMLSYMGYSFFTLAILSMLLVARAKPETSLLWPTFRRIPAWKWLLIAAALSFAVVAIEHFLNRALDSTSGDATWAPGLLFGEDGSTQIAFVVLVVVVGPIAEEFFFRGVLFRFARQYMPFLLSSILISMLFAADHARFWSYDLTQALVALGGAFLTSMAACYVLDRSGSIWTAVLLHSVRNALAVVGYYVSTWL